MALDLALGLVVGELFNAVKEAIQTIADFKPQLKRLESTLANIIPRIDEISSLNKKLDQSERGIDGLKKIVEYGKDLVQECYTLHGFSGRFKRKRHTERLVDLDDNLLRFFTTELQLTTYIELLKARVVFNERLPMNHTPQQDDNPAQVIPIEPGYEAPSYAELVVTDIESKGARDLTIEHSEKGQYWKWSSTTEASSNQEEVAELLKVWFLDVRGYFGTKMLRHGIEYRVVFVVKLIDSARGWEAPVTLKLRLADETTQEHEETFSSIPKEQRNQWLEITVGTFTMSPSTVGVIEFSLEQSNTRVEKKGLLIKGAAIKRICYAPEILVQGG